MANADDDGMLWDNDPELRQYPTSSMGSHFRDADVGPPLKQARTPPPGGVSLIVPPDTQHPGHSTSPDDTDVVSPRDDTEEDNNPLLRPSPRQLQSAINGVQMTSSRDSVHRAHSSATTPPTVSTQHHGVTTSFPVLMHCAGTRLPRAISPETPVQRPANVSSIDDTFAVFVYQGRAENVSRGPVTLLRRTPEYLVPVSHQVATSMPVPARTGHYPAGSMFDTEADSPIMSANITMEHNLSYITHPSNLHVDTAHGGKPWRLATRRSWLYSICHRLWRENQRYGDVKTYMVPLVYINGCAMRLTNMVAVLPNVVAVAHNAAALLGIQLTFPEPRDTAGADNDVATAVGQPRCRLGEPIMVYRSQLVGNIESLRQVVGEFVVKTAVRVLLSRPAVRRNAPTFDDELWAYERAVKQLAFKHRFDQAA